MMRWQRAARFVLVIALAFGFISTSAVAAPAAVSPASDLIAHYYRGILGREPDAGGQAFWDQAAQSLQASGADLNETWRAMAISFYASAEFRARGLDDAAYVASLYATFFDRPPDGGGTAFWTGQLARGLTREVVLLSFLFSPEFDGFVTALFGNTAARAETYVVVDLYRGFLRRLPDAPGFAFWTDRFRAAQCTTTAAGIVAEVDRLSQAFFTGAEYTARDRGDEEFISDLYDAFLRRGADIEGFGYWLARLHAQPGSRDAIRQLFVGSPEFQARAAAVASQGCIDLARYSGLSLGSTAPGPSPFIAFSMFAGANLDRIANVTFTIAAKAGSVSRPVSASLTSAYLARSSHGVQPDGSYRVPVFGLYAGTANDVTFAVRYDDGTVATRVAAIATPAFVDATGIYAAPAFTQRRAAGTDLGFDFFYIKSTVTSPVVMDTDGEVRWWVPRSTGTQSAYFDGASFLLGAADSLGFDWLQLDGRVGSTGQLARPYFRFHHNIDRGKSGALVEVDRKVAAQMDWENILVEMAPDGSVIKEWNLAQIIAGEMAAHGDDPAGFVRLGADWFHMNAATYDPADDSLVVSSRENFVVKIDYASGAIRWIFGDPTKHWFSFPSLRAKALALQAGGRYPVGQHAVSITPEGYLMLFNNGRASISQPAGAPVGEERDYSTVSWYAIDAVARTSREVLSFDHGRTVLSAFCSSAYEAGDSVLVSYALANNATQARLVGLDGNMQVAFEFSLPNPTACQASWNAVPIAFDRLQLR